MGGLYTYQIFYSLSHPQMFQWLHFCMSLQLSRRSKHGLPLEGPTTVRWSPTDAVKHAVKQEKAWLMIEIMTFETVANFYLFLEILSSHGRLWTFEFPLT
jgi:hypothetical protein